MRRTEIHRAPHAVTRPYDRVMSGRQRDVWEYLGDNDADWAVLSAPGMRRQAWEQELDAFYESGKKIISEVLSHMPEDIGRQRALDYGSGTGRLSFALAEVFDRVTAADISRSMLAKVRERAADRGVDNVLTVHLSQDLPSDHNAAFSLITLQHLETFHAVDEAINRISASLIRDGVAVIDFPTPPHSFRQRFQPRVKAYRALRRCGISHKLLDRAGLSGISMLFETPDAFAVRLEAAGLKTYHREYDDQQYSVQAMFFARKTA